MNNIATDVRYNRNILYSVIPRHMVSAAPKRETNTENRISDAFAATAVRKAGELYVTGLDNIKGSVRAVASCTNNRIPTLLPIFKPDFNTGSTGLSPF
jgi:hypothetical protein